MSFRRAVEMTGTSILLFATAALIATSGCSSGGGSSGSGGAPGTGGKTTSTGGKTGSGGATGAGGVGTGGSSAMPTCTPLPADPNMPVLLNFDDMTSFAFGDFSTVFSGSLSLFAGTPPDVSTGAWVIDQDVTGFGNTGAALQILPCQKADLSAFTGIGFDVSGSITPQMAGVDAGPIPPNQLYFQVSTAADDVASNYDAQNNYAPSFGTCVPLQGNQYDGSCASPQVTVQFAPGTPVAKSWTWSQIAGGKGQPSGRATPDPTAITRLSWIFPYNFGNNQVPFHIHLTIDNIHLTTAGGGTPDASSTPDTGTTSSTDSGTGG